MRTKQLVAGAAIVGGAGLTVVGLGPMVVTADASPPIASNEPDPSGPTFTIEPAPSAPSTDISSGTGITSSTDTGSGMPDVSVPDLTVGAPSDCRRFRRTQRPATSADRNRPPVPPSRRAPNGPPPLAWLRSPTSGSWESTTVLPSPCVLPPQPDAPPPPPLQYGGQTVSPAFDGGMRQWGFWYFGNWVPLFGSECQTPAHPQNAEPHT